MSSHNTFTLDMSTTARNRRVERARQVVAAHDAMGGRGISYKNLHNDDPEVRTRTLHKIAAEVYRMEKLDDLKARLSLQQREAGRRAA